MMKNIWVNRSASLILIFVLFSLQLNAIAGASLGMGSGDGLGGSLTAYNEDENDRVIKWAQVNHQKKGKEIFDERSPEHRVH